MPSIKQILEHNYPGLTSVSLAVYFYNFLDIENHYWLILGKLQERKKKPLGIWGEGS